MSRTISISIYVGGQQPENKVGDIQVTEEQFKAAIVEWNSPRMKIERDKWVKHKIQSKVFWDGDRCYPPKKIMRIASRGEVKKLADRQKDGSIKHKIEKGLRAMEGGYQILDTYIGSEIFGFPTEGSLTPSDKAKCGC